MTAKTKKEKLGLTQLTRSGGCGCKISASHLQALLAAVHCPPSADVLRDSTGRDDAAVVRISDDLAIVSTVDFFTPIVDDAYDFGRIAAANAISDVYAMGGRPILALNVLALPLNKISDEQVADLLAGGSERCQHAGISIVGGHSVESAEPLYGLAVNGVINPTHMKTNAGAKAGDIVILSKPLGIGVLAAALRENCLSRAAYQSLVDWAALLNTGGPDLAQLSGVHAMTDVTGFGLLGHLFEICLESRLSACLHVSQLPLIAAALELAQGGIASSASQRNFNDVGARLVAWEEMDMAHRTLLTDPQTSGGLLISCAEYAVQEVLSILHQHACSQAAVIGSMTTMQEHQPVIRLLAA